MSILTIAIPTYNRSEYLKMCLNSLLKNTFDDKRLELLIINNNSQDNTDKIVQSFQQNINIRYIKNKKNIGPDENFKKCIKEAKSKFVWIFGDDDLLFEDSIVPLLDLLEANSNSGLVHIRAENFTDKNFTAPKINNFNFEIIEDENRFIKQVHTNITFISANIVNKEIIFKNINLDDIPNNNLGQIIWSLIAIIKSKKNIFIHSKIFAARQFNSGNYNFCELFGKNFMDCLFFVDQRVKINEIIKIYKKRLTMVYYPANIARLRNGLSKVRYEKPMQILFPIFKNELTFWFFTIPSILLPKKIVFYAYKIAEYICAIK